MKVRDYIKGDFPQVMALWEATGLSRPERGDDESMIEKSIEIGGRLLLLCDEESDGKVIGTSWLTFDGRRLYLHHFGILPPYQGRGLSAILLKESLRYVRDKGYQVKLEVHRTNSVALNLYRKYGFKYLGDYDVFIIRDIQSIDV